MKQYQGATVKCWNTGLFIKPIIHKDLPYHPINHIDVKSQYPSVKILLNLSPETVRLISIKPYTGEYRFDAATRIIEVPDNRNGQVTAQVSEASGITRDMLLELFKEKAEIKSRSDFGTAESEAEYNFVKLRMNAGYGYDGLEFARYGWMLIAIITTAIGRLIISRIIEVCTRFGVTLLECDTDGLYVYNPNVVDPQILIDAINADLHEYFKAWISSDIVTNYWKGISVELNQYDGILIYKRKNYVLLTTKNTLVFHGSGLHGRGLPPLCTKAIDRFATGVLRGEPVGSIWQEYENLHKFPLKEFTLTVGMGKREYKRGSMYQKLLSQLSADDREYLGTELYFVKLRNGYMPLGVKPDDVLTRELDYDYYRARLNKAVRERVLSPINYNRSMCDF